MKIKITIGFMVVFLMSSAFFVYAVPVEDVKHATRKALFEYYDNPESAPLTLPETKNLVDFYLTIPEGQTNVDLPQPMQAIVFKAETNNAECSSGACSPANTLINPPQSGGKGGPGGGQQEACTDSDGGLNYNIKGSIAARGYNYTDYCSNFNMLNEYFCSGNSAASTSANCSCSDGACINNTQMCVPTDRCSNIYKYCYANKVRNYPYCDTADYTYNSGCKNGSIGKCCSGNEECPSEKPLCQNSTCIENAQSGGGKGGPGGGQQEACTDSDGGLNYSVQGTISSSQGDSYTDYCSTSARLNEYFCSGNSISSASFNCPCLNGVCMNQPIATCTDTDGGLNYTFPGYASPTSTGRPLFDFCESLNSKVLQEAVCENGFAVAKNYNCSNGCQNGACNGTIANTAVTKFNINGEITSSLSAGQIYILKDGAILKIKSIIQAKPGSNVQSLVEFCMSKAGAVNACDILDTEEIGQTKTYTLAGQEYEVAVMVIGDSTAASDITFQNSSEFISYLYNCILKRQGDDVGMKYWTNELDLKKLQPKDIYGGFFNSDEYIKKGVSNETFVNQLYSCVLLRDADKDGYDYWLGDLSRLTRNDILKLFIESNEFREKIAPKLKGIGNS